MQLWYAAIVVYVISALVATLPALDIHNTFEDGPSSGGTNSSSNSTTNSTTDSTSPRNEASPADLQFFYYLFMIPGMAAFNALVWYILHYRHLRHLFYRVEDQVARNFDTMEKIEELRSSAAEDTSVMNTNAKSSLRKPAMIKNLKGHRRPTYFSRSQFGDPWCDEVRFVADMVDNYREEVEEVQRKVADLLHREEEEREAKAALRSIQSPSRRNDEESVGMNDSFGTRRSMPLYSRARPTSSGRSAKGRKQVASMMENPVETMMPLPKPQALALEPPTGATQRRSLNRSHEDSLANSANSSSKSTPPPATNTRRPTHQRTVSQDWLAEQESVTRSRQVHSNEPTGTPLLHQHTASPFVQRSGTASFNASFNASFDGSVTPQSRSLAEVEQPSTLPRRQRRQQQVSIDTSTLEDEDSRTPRNADRRR